ncbi:DUF2252 domain-containing protein [Angustibacter luteus]|uniref:DUF2252 domain-containing protein n=1 Tax=Angustibacter luteus TaxID=658456 RepID=A0ABW1JE07_9ACTN
MTATDAHSIPHLTRDERVAAGKAARERLPLDSHADYVPQGRPDPVDVLEGQATTRVPELVPIRYGRMLATPFTFYRGGALLMAGDLSRSPSSGLSVQLCGDAHLSNFGAFATPERRLVFDLNDFDETHPGPFEWDIKRLCASLTVAAQNNDFSAKQQRKVAAAAAATYRETMRSFARQGNLDVWYTHLDMEEAIRTLGEHLGDKVTARAEAALKKARNKNSLQALGKLTTTVDGQVRILSQPPLLVPVEELWPHEESDYIYATLRDLVRSYRTTLQSDRQHLLEQFRLVQVARKVVGVGSVGTRAWILLFEGVDSGDPLFLQAKEAQPSVLADFVDIPSVHNHGERVVRGQHLMQAASDIFLGWQSGTGPEGTERDFYVRQLRDGKGSAVVEIMEPRTMTYYGRLCAQTLARAHARSGDRVAIAAYLGSKSHFEEAVADFSVTYAEQNALDHAALAQAVASGRVEAKTDL